MENAAEKEKALPVDQVPDNVWFQITFTLDPKSYRRLWAYAESVNSGVSSVVREKILEFLKELKPLPSVRRFHFGLNDEESRS
ncbi:MAG TPA: hypothetical protein P5561_05235 [Candidatus Omnitrophota bacterium]|nr:hypothetical protein [Candidatus Omnitrophota bacterium]HRY85913.1 hypothetical protein [Candidatus Omnitrophota bacterium]